MPLNIDWQQILLHLFNFVVLTGVLYFLLYKPVKSFMDKRTEEYRSADEKANKTVSDVLEENARLKEEIRRLKGESENPKESSDKNTNSR